MTPLCLAYPARPFRRSAPLAPGRRPRPIQPRRHQGLDPSSFPNQVGISECLSRHAVLTIPSSWQQTFHPGIYHPKSGPDDSLAHAEPRSPRPNSTVTVTLTLTGPRSPEPDPELKPVCLCLQVAVGGGSAGVPQAPEGQTEGPGVGEAQPRGARVGHERRVGGDAE